MENRNTSLLLLLFLLLMNAGFAQAPQIKIQAVGENNIEVANYLGFSHTIQLMKGKEVIQSNLAGPNASCRFTIKVNRRSIRQYHIEAIYDEAAYKQDLVLIDRIAQARERQQQWDAFWRGVLVAADDYFLDGAVSTFISGVKSLRTAFSDMSLEEKSRALAKEWGPSVVTSQIENRAKRAVAAGAIEAIGALLEEPENDDLVRLSEYCLAQFLNGRVRAYPLKDYISFYPSYTFSAAVMYPLATEVLSYGGIKYDDKEGRLSGFAELNNSVHRPLEIRLQNYWALEKSKPSYSHRMIALLNLYGAQSPIFYSRPGNDVFDQGQGAAYRHLGLEAGIGFRPIGHNSRVGFNLAVSVGAMASFRSEVSFVGDDPAKAPTLELSPYEYDFTGGRWALHPTIDLGVVLLQYSLQGALDLSNQTDIEEDYFSSYSHKVGLAIPLARRYKQL